MTDANDGLTLNPNGTITIPLDDKSVILRRPKVKEFRRLREAWGEAEGQIVALSRRSLAASADLDQRAETLMVDGKVPIGDDDALAALDQIRAEASKHTLELSASLGDLRVGWLCDVIRTLAQSPIPAMNGDEDPLADLADSYWSSGLIPPDEPGLPARQLASSFIAHWMTAPKAPSS